MRTAEYCRGAVGVPDAHADARQMLGGEKGDTAQVQCTLVNNVLTHEDVALMHFANPDMV